MTKMIITILKVLILILAMTACNKRDVFTPQKPAPGQPTQQPGNGEDNHHEDSMLTIKVKAVIRIGDITYDSIPARLSIISWDNGKARVQQISLKPGTNEVKIHKQSSHHELELIKWNMSDKMVLDKANIQENMTYLIGGGKEAKKLKKEMEYVLINGQYVAKGSTEYIYDPQGKLERIMYYKKNKQGVIYTAMSEWLSYTNHQVTSIIKLDSASQIIEKNDFTYDQQGKIISMRKEDISGVVTRATVTRIATINGVETGINYQYSHNSITMHYAMLFSKGNLLQGVATTNHHNSEIGRYEYDTNINPYAHMNWPDIFLSRQSKNNVIWSSKEYYGSYPISDPVNYRYVYYSDGYPAELLKDYKAHNSTNILYTTKTTYHY
ncbi:MAG: hypothetical protein IBJ16_12955 [Chitinophagaceae bacterium]|nr:hypothetical protein [Chitinophagaceae bacterium]